MDSITNLGDFYNILGLAQERENLHINLAQLLQIYSLSHPTLSGLNEIDYPNCNANEFSFSNLSSLTNLKITLFPPEIFEQINKVSTNLKIGVFREIDCAYFAIDKNLYLWDFNTKSDFISYDGLDEIIMNAALLRPINEYCKIGVSYILALISINTIVFLPLTLSEELPRINLGYDPLLTLPLDGLIFNHIVTSQNSRIFLACNDGCLYELVYQLHQNWLGKRAWLINQSRGKISSIILPSLKNIFTTPDPLVQIIIDNKRNNLYTLSDQGDIQLYYLGPQGTDISYIISSSHNENYNRAIALTKLVDRPNFGKIVSLSVIDIAESLVIHLCATTLTGFRYYFSTRAYDDYKAVSNNISDEIVNAKPPYTLKLVHLRFPPGYSSSSGNALESKNNISAIKNFTGRQPQNKLSHVFKSLVCKESVLMLDATNDLSDTLTLFNSANFPYRQVLMESQSLADIDGKIWTIEECQTPYYQPRPFSIDSEFFTNMAPVNKSLQLQNLNLTSSMQAKYKLIHYDTKINVEGAVRSYGTGGMIETPVNNNYRLGQPRICKQIYRSQRRFVMLTSQKLFQFEVIDPCNYLKALLSSNAGQVEGTLIRAYMLNLSRQYSPLTMSTSTNLSLALANAIHLMCTLGPGETQIAQWTLQLLGFYGSSGIDNICGSNFFIQPSQRPQNTGNFNAMNFEEPPFGTPYLQNKPKIPGGILKSTPAKFSRNFLAASTPYQNFTSPNIDNLSKNVLLSSDSYINKNLKSSTPYAFKTNEQSATKRFKYLDQSSLPAQGPPSPAIPINLLQEALLRYFSRIVKPIWHSPICATLSDILTANNITPNQIISHKILTEPSLTNYVQLLLQNSKLSMNKHNLRERERILLEEEATLRTPEILCNKIILPIFNTIDFSSLADKLDALLKFCEKYRTQLFTITSMTLQSPYNSFEADDQSNRIKTEFQPTYTDYKNNSAFFSEISHQQSNNISNLANNFSKKRVQKQPPRLDISSDKLMDISTGSTDRNNQTSFLTAATPFTSPQNISSFKRKNVTFASSYSGDLELRKTFTDNFAETFIKLLKRAKELALLWKFLFEFQSESYAPFIFATLSDADRDSIISLTFGTIVQSSMFNELTSTALPLTNKTPFPTNNITNNTASNTINMTNLLSRIIFAYLNYNNNSAYINNEPMILDSETSNINVKNGDILIKRLQQCCGSFYGTDQAIISKANEYLAIASNEINRPPVECNNLNGDMYEINTAMNCNSQRETYLKESLQLLLQADPSEIDLYTICSNYQNMEFYDGIVELCLSCANTYKIVYQKLLESKALSFSQTNLVAAPVSNDAAFYLEVYRDHNPILNNNVMPSGGFDLAESLLQTSGRNIPVEYANRLTCYGIIISTLQQLFDRLAQTYTSNETNPYQQSMIQNSFDVNENNNVTNIYDFINNSQLGDANLSNQHSKGPAGFIANGIVQKDMNGLPLCNKLRVQLLAALDKCVISNDELFCYVLFDWLIKTGLTDYLIKCGSPYLESYLVKSTENVKLNRNLSSQSIENLPLSLFQDVKWKYLQHKKLYLKAAIVLNELAESKDHQIPMNSRIEHLSRALMLVRTSIATPSSQPNNIVSDIQDTDLYMSPFNKEKLAQEIQDKLDVMQLQLKVLTTINSKYGDQDKASHLAIKHLNERVYDLTQLFQDFCEKFGLWECQLDIMQAAQYADRDVILDIWTKLITDTLNQNIQATNSNVNPMGSSTIFDSSLFSPNDSLFWPSSQNKLKDFRPNTFAIGPALEKIYTLGLRFLKNDNNDNKNSTRIENSLKYENAQDIYEHPYFPTKYLIRFLENKCFEQKMISLAVPLTFLRLDLPEDEIFKMYQHLYQKKISTNENFGLHLAHVMLLFISYLIDHKTQISNKRQLRNLFLNFISSLTHDLQTMPNDDRKLDLQKLITMVQSKIYARKDL